MFCPISDFDKVLYSCQLFSSYARNHKDARNLKKNTNFSLLIFDKVFLPVSKFSSRMIDNIWTEQWKVKDWCCQHVYFPLGFGETGEHCKPSTIV